jgi:hypothetical protein
MKQRTSFWKDILLNGTRIQQLSCNRKTTVLATNGIYIQPFIASTVWERVCLGIPEGDERHLLSAHPHYTLGRRNESRVSVLSDQCIDPRL